MLIFHPALIPDVEFVWVLTKEILLTGCSTKHDKT